MTHFGAVLQKGKLCYGLSGQNGSQHTHWREASLTDEDIWKKELEIVPIAYAELHNLSPELLRPGQLPELWQDENMSITVSAIQEFFNSDDVPELESDNILFETIQAAVKTGLLMARHQNRAYFKENIRDAEITDDLELLLPLESISGSELSHNSSPDAWANEKSSVDKLMDALATRKGSPDSLAH